MLWISRSINNTIIYKTVAVLLVALTLLSAAISADERHISVFSPVATYSLPMLDRGGREYVGLLELLEPLGRVSSQSNGRSLRLRYNAVDAEFFAGKTQARIQGSPFELQAPFLIENARGIIPLNSVTALLPRFVGTPATFRENGRRLLIGDVGIQPSFRLESGNLARLDVSFSAPVNPTISTEPGKLRMIFKREPVVSPGSSSTTFENKIITRADYSESDGAAEIDISANASLMATFTSDRKSILISAIEASGIQPGTTSNTVPPGSPPAPGSQSPPAQPPPAAPTAAGNAISVPLPHRTLAVVDAAHGGDDRGAAFTEALAEKDVTLGFARLLRHELELRGFAVLLLRDADTTIALDQRAAAANTARAGIYITVHATSLGNGVHVYTAMLPVEGQNRGTFHAWNAAQSSALPISRTASTAILTELQKKEFPVRGSFASLRPLNNVVMPAVAVELGPGPNGLSDLTSANYQQRASSAIADAVVAVRDRLVVQQ